MFPREWTEEDDREKGSQGYLGGLYLWKEGVAESDWRPRMTRGKKIDAKHREAECERVPWETGGVWGRERERRINGKGNCFSGKSGKKEGRRYVCVGKRRPSPYL